MADLCPGSYIFKHCPRVSERGGGVAFLYKDSLQVIMSSENYDSFECMSATISSDSSCMDISVIYRPPGGHSFSKFLEEFSDFLDGRMYRTPPFVITGDLNIHLDNNSAPWVSIPGGGGGGGMGGYIPPPNISGGGGMACTIIPPIIHHQKKKKIKRKIKDESPMRVVNGYYSQDDHQYTHFAISFS